MAFYKMASSMSNFDKLNGSNYATWAFKMEMCLVKEDLWSYIESEKPEGDGNDLRVYLSKSKKALACIALMIEDDQAILISGCKGGREAWFVLKNHYQQSSISFKIRILKRLFKMQLPVGGNMQEHLNTILVMVKELHDRGADLTNEQVVSIMLASLNHEYESLITAIESWDETKLTMASVKSKLLEEYERKKESSNQSTAELALKVNSMQFVPKYGDECFFCGEMGHYKRNCPVRGAVWKSNVNQNQYNPNQNNQGQNQTNKRYKKHYTCLSFKSACTGEWYVDSGCSQHMTCDESVVNDLEVEQNGQVEVASGHVLTVQGQGNVKLGFKTPHNQSMELKNVLLVPDLKCNLISVRQLARSGYNVVFKDEHCSIADAESSFILAKCCDGLYKVECDVILSSPQSHKANLCVHQWHSRLAHRHLADILAMKGQGLCVMDCECSDICEPCLQGKMARRPFPKISSPVEKVLDCVATDVCGPLSVESLGHKRYFVTFTDLKSGYCTVYFMKTKDETKKYVKIFVERMKTLKNDKPKTIRSDRGGEYLDGELQEYLALEGIKFECTVGYSPQQNGVSERRNRTLMEAARTLLADSKLPKSFWAEAVHHSNYVFNRIVSRKHDKSPFEQFYGSKPSIDEIHAFGTYVYVWIPDIKRNKLDVKSEKMRFVGIDEQSKGFRVADCKKRTVKVSREVKFLEGTVSDTLPDDVNVELSVVNQNKNNDNLIFGDSNVCDFHENSDDTELVQDQSDVSVVQEEEEVISDQSNNTHHQNTPIQVRRSSRVNQGQMPARFNDYYCYSVQSENKYYEPSSFKDAMSCPDKEKWYAAMLEELKSIESNETWILSDLPVNRRAVGCKWVYKLKFDEKGNISQYKARLVAQGFSQKYGQDYDEVFAPVANSVTFRLLLSVAGAKRFHVKHFDVKTAFLNGILQEEIYMRQPPGFENVQGKVLKLRKSIYGLKQAARVWNQALHRALLDCGCIQSNNDKCLYMLRNKEHVCYVLIHVDDLLVSSSSDVLINKVFAVLSNNFELKDLGDVKQYLGISIERDVNGHFSIDQTSYIEKIVTEVGLQDAKISSYPIDQGYYKNVDSNYLSSNEQYRKVIGMLLYISTNTRPDVAASVSILSQKVIKPTIYDWNELKRVVRYLKGSKDLKLHLSSEVSNKELYAYTDANFAEDPTHGKSNSGLFVGVNGGALTWHCRKQQVVALSTTEAEYISLCDAGKELVWIKRLCEDFDINVNMATPVYEDNQSCIKMIMNDSQSGRTKHIRVKYHYTRDLVESSEINIIYCPTEHNTADMMTKPLGPTRLEYLRKRAFLEPHN